MEKLSRFVDCTTLSLAVAAFALAGCGSNSSGTPSTNPDLGTGTGGGVAAGPGTGGVAGPSTGSGSAVVAGTGATATTPVGSGGVTTTSPGAGGTTTTSPPGAGGTAIVPAAGGATTTPGAGGAGTVPPAAGGGAGTGTVNGMPDTSWGSSTNIDAMGLLIAPPSDKGFQIATPVFQLDPGQEVFKCYHVALPNSGEFDVGNWESVMAKGSHHFILYRTDSDTVPSGTLDTFGCTTSFGSGEWIYSAAVPHTGLALPDGVALPLASAQKVQFDMHYINTGMDALQAHVTLNVNKVVGTNFQKAQSQVSFNTLISIPPNGTQTVGGDCTPAAGGKYFMMLTHTHRRGVDASITRKLANGQLGEVLVHTTNWDSPENYLWENPPYLTFQAGEKFHYKCSYQNDRSTTTTVGVSAANNEMCMAITYFFPAVSPPACTSGVE